MRRFLQSIALMAAILAAPAGAVAGDREDVLQVTHDLFAALKTGDAAALDRMIPKEGFSEFPGRGKGRLLIRWDAAGIVAAIKGGLRSDVQFLHPEATLIGPDQAFVTGYRYGQVYQGAPTPAFTTRGTLIYRRVGGQWKIVHMHFSPLVPES